MQDTADDINFYQFIFYGIGIVAFYILMDKLFPGVRWFFPPSIVLISGVILFFSTGKYILWRSRYKGYHVTVHGFSGSIYGDPDYIPDPTIGKGFHWAVFNTGFSLLPPLRGKLATLVVPANQLYKAGKNYVGLTLVSKTRLGYGLPHSVSWFLRENKLDFNTEKIFFGRYSKEFLDNSNQQKDFQAQNSALNSTIDVYKLALTQDHSVYEKLKNLGTKLTGEPGIIKKMIRKASVQEDE